MKVKLSKSLCEGFVTCAVHVPDVFKLDVWGYASVAGDDSVPPGQEDQVRRAIIDCPAHAIAELE
jgi:ferredoxin